MIDHINDIRDDNRLKNLQLITNKDNSKKSAKKHGYKFAANSHKNRKCVKTINRTINEITFYHSTYYAQRLRINADNAKIVCEGINNCKSRKLKKGQL